VPLAPSLGAEVAASETLPAGHDARLGLRLANERAEPWAHGPPHGIARAAVQWTELATGRVSTTTVPLMLPLVVGGGERVAVPLRVMVPTRVGRYALDVRLPSRGLATQRRIIEVHNAPPLETSAEAGARLAARYLVEDDAALRTLLSGDSLPLRLVAVNTGKAVWLMKPRGKKGDVALRWRWLDAAGRALDHGAGHAPIRYDVRPGQRYEFDEWPAPPVDAGRYVLEAGLARGGSGAFEGIEPVRLVVEVTPPLTGPARP